LINFPRKPGTFITPAAEAVGTAAGHFFIEPFPDPRFGDGWCEAHGDQRLPRGDLVRFTSGEQNMLGADVGMAEAVRIHRSAFQQGEKHAIEALRSLPARMAVCGRQVQPSQ
jgi:hypothetical protein